MGTPSWLKNAVATPKGFIDQNGALLKSVRLSQAQIDEFNNPVQDPEPEAPVVVNTDGAVKVSVDIDCCDNPDCECEPGECDCEPKESATYWDEKALKKMSKKDIETHGRSWGLELDRRKSKNDMISELLEHIKNYK